jgi:hypothetical protein
MTALLIRNASCARLARMPYIGAKPKHPAPFRDEATAKHPLPAALLRHEFCFLLTGRQQHFQSERLLRCGDIDSSDIQIS